MSNLPNGVVQGPDGKFRSVDDRSLPEGQLEYQNYDIRLRIPASDLDDVEDQQMGEQNAVEGISVVNFEEELDRDELAFILTNDVTGWLWQLTEEGTGGDAGGSVYSIAEFSASEARTLAFPVGGIGEETLDELRDETQTNAFSINGAFNRDDTADLLHRPLHFHSENQFADTTNGTGGGGDHGYDHATGPVHGDDWLVDDRDEVFTHAAFSVNSNNGSGILLRMVGQMTYWVFDEEHLPAIR